MSYADVLDALTRAFIVIAMVPKRLLEAALMPAAVKRIAQANNESPLYTEELLRREKTSLEQD